ncbi:MAG: CPBP family intramembrane metalloprotease [Candidatus Pacebacteria bacterium]|nr:CPBP family intramembrane metalloprotease [Candidatus Paceibacterota bacterium]
MTETMKWLRDERSPMWLLGFAIAIAIIDLIIAIPIGELLEPYLANARTKEEEEELVKIFLGDNYATDYKRALFHTGLFGTAFVFALIEELAFRTLPLGIAISAQRKSWVATALVLVGAVLAAALAYDNLGAYWKDGLDPKILSALGAMLVLSITAMLFTNSPIPLWCIVLTSSALFAYVHHGWMSIFLQGIGGVALSVVYLKCGGLEGRWLKATWYSTVSHTFFNFVLFEYMLYTLLTATVK